MSAGPDCRVEGVVLAGALPWDEPFFETVLLRPLVPVGHLPLIFHVLTWLKGGGVLRSTICANSSSRIVRSCLGDGSRLGVSLDYYEDLIPRGPAGCTKDAVRNSDADVFVVVDGTIIPRINLARLIETHCRSGAAATVVVRADRQAVNAEEHLVPTGIYVFHRRALDYIRDTSYQDTKEVLIPLLHVSGEHVMTYMAEGECPRITDAATYLSVNGCLLEEMALQSPPMPGYRVVGEGFIHASADVAPGANLIGPVLIGPGTRVEGLATVVGPTSIGAECLLRESAVVCRSVLWDRCTVNCGSVVDRCVLTNEAVVDPQARLYGVIHMQARHSAVSHLRTWADGIKQACSRTLRAVTRRGVVATVSGSMDSVGTGIVEIGGRRLADHEGGTRCQGKTDEQSDHAPRQLVR